MICSQNAHVFICGNLEMGKEVTSILENLVSKSVIDSMTESK